MTDSSSTLQSGSLDPAARHTKFARDIARPARNSPFLLPSQYFPATSQHLSSPTVLPTFFLFSTLCHRSLSSRPPSRTTPQPWLLHTFIPVSAAVVQIRSRSPTFLLPSILPWQHPAARKGKIINAAPGDSRIRNPPPICLASKHPNNTRGADCDFFSHSE